MVDAREGFYGWPPEAIALVERAAETHGGFERYGKLESVSFVLKNFGGPLPWMKGLELRSMPRRVQVFPHARKARFEGFPELGQDGVFDQGHVSLVSRGSTLSESQRHRDTFRGLGRYRRWAPLDTLYFFGCALTTYLALPFCLRDLSFVEMRRFEQGGRVLAGVTVDFPPDFQSHCARQSFFFDEQGFLVRHDYTADIVGPWALGAHFSEAYEFVEGIPFATRRRVVARLGAHPTPMPVLYANLAEFKVS